MSSENGGGSGHPIAGGGIGGAVVVVGLYILEETTGIKVPADVAAAITTLVIALFALIGSKF